MDVLRKIFQFIHAKIKLGDEVEWMFSTVYASPREEGRREMWNELQRIVDNMDIGWIVCGDFNDILSGAEKREGDIPSMRNCGKFQDIINGCNLMDLGSS